MGSELFKFLHLWVAVFVTEDIRCVFALAILIKGLSKSGRRATGYVRNGDVKVGSSLSAYQYFALMYRCFGEVCLDEKTMWFGLLCINKATGPALVSLNLC